MIQIDKYIFQMGWFNHQLEEYHKLFLGMLVSIWTAKIIKLPEGMIWFFGWVSHQLSTWHFWEPTINALLC